MKVTEVHQLLEKCKAATQVSQKWWLDHDDTYVGALQIPDEHDWYWVSGDMSKPDDGYSGAVSDEEYRGPKEVIQTHCRFIAAANPQAIQTLAENYLEAIEEMKIIADNDAADGRPFQRARDFLKKVGCE